ncbi:coiled-coil domain-containing protein 183-like [Balearica regulorum gibbericeps]|uniref:coiled-coil domain-containing protein 183-like n=1 Tax=Balearica regulorum gibbericeps TaxID=100784 RepID=UPI003F606494
MAAAGLEGRGGSASTAQGRKAKLSQHTQELRTMVALQEQGRKVFAQCCEEKLRQKRELLPHLREAVQEDVRALGSVQAVARSKLPIAAACGAQRHVGMDLAGKTVECPPSPASSLANSPMPIQVALEELRAEIYEQRRTCDMLLDRVRQRSQTRDELQRRLQQLQDAKRDEKQHQAQVQAIHQLENNIEKMLAKGRAAQKVTARYLVVRDALRKELAHLPPHLDLLCGMAELYPGELEDMELMASDALRAADVAKEDMAEMKTQLLAERERRYRSLAAQEVHGDRLWLKEASKRQPRAQARSQLTVDFPSLHSQDPLVDAKLEATQSPIEREAWLTEKMEKAKAAAQRSCPWDIPSRLLAQQKSWVELEQHVKEGKQKKAALKETLKELELKQAELKFGQPRNTPSVVGSRMLEEDLRVRLQREEAQLEQARTQALRNEELLLHFENGMDNLLVHLHGIPVPDQDDSVKPWGVVEKLQYGEQKLRYLAQCMANLPRNSYSPDENNETFVHVRDFLEKATASDPQNLQISLDDVGSRVQDPSDFSAEDHGLVPTRQEIKQQGLLLLESRKKSSREK